MSRPRGRSRHEEAYVDPQSSSRPRPRPNRSRSHDASYDPPPITDPYYASADAPPGTYAHPTSREPADIEAARRARRTSIRRESTNRSTSRRTGPPVVPPRRMSGGDIARDPSRGERLPTGMMGGGPPPILPGSSAGGSSMSSQPRRHKWVRKSGDAGRRGIHPTKCFIILLRSTSRLSMLCNFLWPVVPVALAMRYAWPIHHTTIFALSYIAMIPCANMVGFTGTELARKLPHVWGVLVEVTLGSIVEIVLFMVLLVKDQFLVIKAAILGSILATMLLCLGMCFIVGGVKREEQKFEDTISETGSGLLLTAGVSLTVPSIFMHSLANQIEADDLDHRTLEISRAVSLFLVFSYIVYGYFQARTHHGIYDAIFKQDEKTNDDYHQDKKKPRLTMTETLLALSVSLTLVTLISISLVNEIEPLVEKHGISDPFMGLILVPLVEKFAEHLGAINEAWDNQMNFALSHVLGATVQTALFNGPLTIIVAWCAGKGMDLTFVVFDMAMLLLSIITVGGFLRDGKSNYLEGVLCVMLYLSIAVAAFFYPNLHTATTAETGDH